MTMVTTRSHMASRLLGGSMRMQRSPQSTLVVIDAAVEAAHLLAVGVSNDADVIILDPNQDGIEQITRYLWEHLSVRRLTLIAHGHPGTIALGTTHLTSDSISHYSQDWDLWSRHLDQIMIYGCRVAADTIGRTFLETLYQNTGVAIAASSHLVGNAAKGGTWHLDYQIGQIDITSPLRPDMQASYGGLLGTLIVNSLDDNTSAGDGQVTLREAIAAANNDTTTDLGDQASGMDTIIFDASLSDSIISLNLGELLVTSSIMVDGSTAPGLVISGNLSSRVFNITDGTSTLNAVTISDGAATNGAGVRVENANVTLQNSVLTEHVDAGSGGALHASGSTLTVTNTTITGNTSANFGAGMTLVDGTDATVTFSTIANNQGSGIDRVGDATLSIGHTLLADNTRGNIPLSAGNTTSLNYNLTDDITIGLNQSQDRIARADSDIRLGVFGNYGGPTQTIPLLPGSIAIDAGAPTSPVTQDQRGVARPVNGGITTRSDIGAFEAAQPVVTINPVTTNDGTPELTGTVTLPGGVDVDNLTVVVTINGIDYTADNNGDGTWILADDTITPLVDGTYDVQVSATNVSGTGTDTTTDELVIDAAAPVVTVTPLTTNDSTPELTGTVDDQTATITVTVNGTDYTATNNGNGTWILPDNTITPLTDATFDVEVTATDALGNVGVDATLDELVIDAVSPTVTLTPQQTNDATPRLSGTVDDMSAVLEVTVNRTTYLATNNGDGTWTLDDDQINPPLLDGIYDVVVAATDSAGNVGIDLTTNELTVDTVLPIITIDPLATTDGTPDLSGTVSEATTLIEITVEGTPYEATNNGDGTWTLDGDTIFPALGDGTYNIIARALDVAGNEGFDATLDELVVDTTPPTVTIAPLNTNDATPQLTGTVDDPTAAIAVTIDDATYDATNNGDGTWTLADNIAQALPDGTYDVSVSATDATGNIGIDTTLDELLIDTRSPTVTIDALITNDTTPELTGTIDDPNATVTVTIAGKSYVADNNGDGTWTLKDDTINPALEEDVYDVLVEATDTVGNVGTDATVDEVLIDATPPEITINLLITNDSTPGLTGTVNEAMATIEVTINGTTYAAINNGDGTWALADDVMSALADGTYDVEATATDGAGNVGVDATLDELVVDAIAPVVTLEDVGTNDPSPELTGTIDDLTATIQVTVNRTNYTATNNGDGTWTLADNTIFPDLVDDTYEVVVSAVDAATNVGTDTASLLIDTVAPTVTVDPFSTNDATPELTGTVSEVDATIEVTINGNAYEATNNGDGTWTLANDQINPPLGDGRFDVSVVATDGAGNTGIDDTADELFVDTVAPTLTVDVLSTNDPTPRLSGTIDDPTALIQITIDRNAYTATNVGDGTWVLDDNTITPPLVDGTYDIQVVALDSVGNIGTDTTIDELQLDSTPPTVTVTTLLTTDTTPELTGTVDDNDAPVTVMVNGITYAATNNGNGTWTLADGVISPSLADGTYDVSVTATDAFGNEGTDSSTDELVVDTTPPVVTVDTLSTNDNTPVLTGILDDPTANLEITVNDVTFTVTTLLNGTWELELPEPLEDGTYDVAAVAIDAVGNTGLDSTSNELLIDTIAPQVGVDSLLTNDTSPPLSGTIDDPTAVVQVGIGGQVFTVNNNGDGTWTLDDNVINPGLAEGVFDVKAVATDSVGNLSIDTTLNEIVVDATPPTVDIVNVTPDPGGPVTAIALNFSEAVSGLDVSDFTLTRDGVAVSLTGATLQSSNGITWTLGNLTSATTQTASYTLTLRSAGTAITDVVGNVLQAGATDTWSVQNLTSEGLPAPTSINGQLGTPPSPIDFGGGNSGVNQSGTGGDDRLDGTNNRDRLDGRGGDDRLFGERGNDRLVGGNGNDRLFGGNGEDRLDGDNGDDRLEGEAGRDRLRGGRGSDRLIGGGGSDVLIGGGGSDRLTGDAGRDVFTFEDLSDGVDTITDFNTTDDLIDLSGILASPQFAAASAFAKVTQFVRLNQVGSNTEVSIDADGNGSGTALRQIIILQGINIDAVVSTNFLA